MAKTVGDFLVERLRAWGVQRVFGYPGDGINGAIAAFEHSSDEGPRFIQARHEELSAFMAGAHAKFRPPGSSRASRTSGRPPMCSTRARLSRCWWARVACAPATR